MSKPATRALFADEDYDGAVIGDAEQLRRVSGENWPEQHNVFWSRVERNRASDRKHLVDLYDAGIRDTDTQIGILLDDLRARGLLENTIVVVVSDHGEEFLEHGQYLHEQLYEELLHVPLIISFPGDKGARYRGRREKSLVRLVDVAPTLLDFLGLPIPEGFDGLSLVPLLEGGTGPPRLVSSSWLKAGKRALRLGDWKLVVDERGPELYDLAADPLETRNLAAVETARLESLASELRRVTTAADEFRYELRGGVAVQASQEALDQLRALGYLN